MSSCAIANDATPTEMTDISRHLVSEQLLRNFWLMKIIPLGAGQDVGRSCILVTIQGRNIMLDCGMHMGFDDERRFPDFDFIARDGPLDAVVDCVLISHFHLDHCGALPYMTEKVGYSGPLYMTLPTKAICPILLDDFRRLSTDKNGEEIFSKDDIVNSMKKVKTVSLHETIKVDDEMTIKAYYAGHVLGAAMFRVEVRNESFVYTGDYNMTADRHLGAAWIDRCRPDLLITESTYATTIRDSKRTRERTFLKKVHDCINRGGKVLIPCFALGRAQELCILLDSYWERMNLTCPIYFSTGLTEKASNYYQMFITWTSEKIKRTFVQHNMFEYKHIEIFDRNYIDNEGPMVVFATPGMLHAGLSLQIFKKWAGDDKNMVILPGYCVSGTVGDRILRGERKLELDQKIIDVNMSVEYMSFSAHADAKGIMQLIQRCRPRNVLLVHGENSKMEILKNEIVKHFGCPCYKPANGESVNIEPIGVTVSLDPTMNNVVLGTDEGKLFHGLIRTFNGIDLEVVSAEKMAHEQGNVLLNIRFKHCVSYESISKPFNRDNMENSIRQYFDGLNILLHENNIITVESIVIEFLTDHMSISWSLQDDELTENFISLL
ncbi:hypothetical protein GJ496_004978 [Pomphorhynchus laevis]|nr:hypothetical protein GJ496_004978 [Pomphorhynchus laevis]